MNNNESDDEIDTPKLLKETEKVPKFSSIYLLTILNIMAKHHSLDDEISSLICSFKKKYPSRARPSIDHYDFFIILFTRIVLVQQKERDRILVPRSLKSELL